MNGRIYDYQSGRFLSVDPFISMPGSSQAYNPYSYVMNNPLSYTDPTGYIAESNYSNGGMNGIASDTSCVGNYSIECGSPGGSEKSNNQKYRQKKCKSDNCAGLNKLLSQSNGHLSSNLGTSGDNFLSNEEQHPPIIGDSTFDTNDETFHHYDTFTPFCKEGSSGCTIDILIDDVLYHFSYPSEGLLATPAALDGRPVVAYVVGPFDAALGNTNDPSNYDTPVGRVVQLRTSDGGIQNKTLRDHGMYNGNVTRKVVSRSGVLGIWTHGIGVNKFLNKGGAGISSWANSAIDYVNKKLAQANDVFGPQAFAAMDAQAKRYWNNKYGN